MPQRHGRCHPLREELRRREAIRLLDLVAFLRVATLPRGIDFGTGVLAVLRAAKKAFRCSAREKLLPCCDAKAPR